jgi:hypothetical protein
VKSTTGKEVNITQSIDFKVQDTVLPFCEFALEPLRRDYDSHIRVLLKYPKRGSNHFQTYNNATFLWIKQSDKIFPEEVFMYFASRCMNGFRLIKLYECKLSLCPFAVELSLEILLGVGPNGLKSRPGLDCFAQRQ